MFNSFFLLFFFILSIIIVSIFASTVSPAESSEMNCLKRKLSPKIVQDDFSTAFSPIHPQNGVNNKFNLLADDLIQKIFEFLIKDYASIRLVSKDFRRIYDNFIYKISWSGFPCFTPDTLSQWNSEYLKYKLIPLAQVLYLHVSPLIKHHSFNNFYEEASNLNQNSMQMIKFLQILNISECLKLTNALLKLKIVQWENIYEILFSTHIETVLISWSLGLTTIAREMGWKNYRKFRESISSDIGGILLAIKGRHYVLSRYMIESIRNYGKHFVKDNKLYCGEILKELIAAKYWDLARQVYKMDKTHFGAYHLTDIAEQGHIDGLHVFRNAVKLNPEPFAYFAARSGHLGFLEEMYAMNLLQGTSNSAFEGAISSDNAECLDFLSTRLGKKYLSKVDYKGYMQIHIVAQFGKPETLRTIIKHNPYFKPKLSMSQTVSPLHLALSRRKYENAKILIEHFPELINFKDDRKDTVLHLCARNEFNMFFFFLNLASPNIITARNIEGDTVLHLTALTLNSFVVARLMLSGHFTGMERNHYGITPVLLYEQEHIKLSNPISKTHLMDLFNLQSEEQLTEALKVIDGKFLKNL